MTTDFEADLNGLLEARDARNKQVNQDLAKAAQEEQVFQDSFNTLTDKVIIPTFQKIKTLLNAKNLGCHITDKLSGEYTNPKSPAICFPNENLKTILLSSFCDHPFLSFCCHGKKVKLNFEFQPKNRRGDSHVKLNYVGDYDLEEITEKFIEENVMKIIKPILGTPCV